jgi:hypothetical protein
MDNENDDEEELGTDWPGPRLTRRKSAAKRKAKKTVRRAKRVAKKALSRARRSMSRGKSKRKRR